MRPRHVWLLLHHWCPWFLHIPGRRQMVSRNLLNPIASLPPQFGGETFQFSHALNTWYPLLNMKVFQEPRKQFFLPCQYPLIQIAQSNFFENSILAIWTKFYLYCSFKNWQVFQENRMFLQKHTVWRMKKIARSPLMVSSLSGQQDCVNGMVWNGSQTTWILNSSSKWPLCMKIQGSMLNRRSKVRVIVYDMRIHTNTYYTCITP